MSNSYKYPIFKQRNVKYFKRLSNKKIRKYLKSLSVGFKTNKMKVLVSPYDICDYKWFPWKEKDINKSKRK